MNYECQHRKEVVLGYFPVIMLSDLQASGASYSVYRVSGGRRGPSPGDTPCQTRLRLEPDAGPSLESEHQMLYSGPANEITREELNIGTIFSNLQ